jgi:hypothetical protein
MSRRSHWGRVDPELPKKEPLTGPVVGAVRLGVSYHEEGVIAHGADSERWRLTDAIDSLLLPDDEFVVGGSFRDVKEALEARHLSPVPGVSMIEACDGDLKVHTLPFADSALVTVRENPQHAQYRWHAKYIKTWSLDLVATLTRLAMTDDLLVSAETVERLRQAADFDDSDLVVAHRDARYSIVKYRPTKAAARRKTRTTVTRKDQHAADLASYALTLDSAAGTAYTALRGELDRFGVAPVLVEGKDRYYRSYDSDSEDSKRRWARRVRALLPIHAALLGRHAYRHNDAWQAFLTAVRDRPPDLADDTWGNFHDVREWLAAECKLRKLAPTPTMLAAAAAAEEATLRALTCTGCGEVKDDRSELIRPPYAVAARFAPGAMLCVGCYDDECEAINAAAADGDDDGADDDDREAS